MDGTTLSLILRKLIIPLLRLVGFILLGLFAGQAIESLGWTRQFALLARPIFKFSRIGDRCSAAFTTAFISGATANSMLYEFYDNGTINKTQLFLSNYINQLPAFFLHLPTTMFIVLPLTGRAGAYYFLLTFLATMVRVLISMVLGRALLPEEEASEGTIKGKQALTLGRREKIMALLHKVKTSLPTRMLNILIWVLPIYSIVFVMGGAGVFKALNMGLSRHLSLSFIPVESLSVVILSFAAEFTSGFAAAGALLSAGVITVKQTVIALLAGNILAFPIRALRHQLPRYMGIFSPKLGFQLLLSGQLFRIFSLIFVGIFYFMVS